MEDEVNRLKAEAADRGWQVRGEPFSQHMPLIDGVRRRPFVWLRRQFEMLGPFSQRAPSVSPVSVRHDWRSSNTLRDPRMQGETATCVAFSTCAMAEARSQIGGRQVAFSPRYLHFCSMRLDRQTGPFMGLLARTVLQRGMPTATGDEGLGDVAGCSAVGSVASRRVKAVYEFWNAGDVKREIAERGPVIAIMDLREDFARWYAGGIYRATSSPKVGSHAVCLVGYDDSQRCWIGMNSLGKEWGESGFFRLAYDDSGVLTSDPVYSLDLD